MTDLSPAAQAVLNAFIEDNCLHDWKHNHYNIEALAAALRAAADQMGCYQSKKFLYSIADAMKLQNIAAELEAFSNE